MVDDKYRKVPVVVQAYQITQEDINKISNSDGIPAARWPDWFFGAVQQSIVYYDGKGLRIKTLEGTSYTVTVDYWIVRGVNGEMWPVRDDIFQKTYEKVENL